MQTWSGMSGDSAELIIAGKRCESKLLSSYVESQGFLRISIDFLRIPMDVLGIPMDFSWIPMKESDQ
eukprot:6786180-Pyramimonas_sp.AAC.1